ncbi:MAG: hypothetical protein IPJ20_19620 [Flammeovirgaceae bacterium]|nr:hypothetical protein [Flammeovirgaceae bacterium]
MKSSVDFEVKKAVTRILLQFPFFAALLLKRPILEDSTIKTACTDGRQIWYNPTWFATLKAHISLGCCAMRFFIFLTRTCTGSMAGMMNGGIGLVISL